jgi:hypothetical protein
MSVVTLVILISLCGLAFMYIILDLVYILTFGQKNGKEITRFKNNMSFKESVINFYKVIRLINIKEFNDSFEIHTRMNGGYILSISYYMKIIDVDNVLLICKSSYQFGYTLSTYKKIDNVFQEYKINITYAPALFYYYRYYKLDKLINNIPGPVGPISPCEPVGPISPCEPVGPVSPITSLPINNGLPNPS